MRLKDYLSTLGIEYQVFADKVGMTKATINNLVLGKKDVYLTTALKIEKETMGVVKCKDLAPLDFEV